MGANSVEEGTMNLGPLGLAEVSVVDADEAAAIEGAALQAGQDVRSVDLPEALSSGQLLDQLGSALLFPDYFGRNWDAVDECLQDINWIQGRATVILVFHADRLLSTDCLTAINFVRTLARASTTWRERHISLRVVLVGSKRLFNTTDAILRPL